MKGEFDEGYKGLVNINLQDFVLNMKKENSYSTEIQVHLKTLIMEDLLEVVSNDECLVLYHVYHPSLCGNWMVTSVA
jgi:hypothetical protein